jgi:hypothetical protein
MDDKEALRRLVAIRDQLEVGHAGDGVAGRLHAIEAALVQLLELMMAGLREEVGR